MLSIGTGHSASYLLDAVATGRENYYTGAVTQGEPAGRWYGAGAAAFGLTGQVDAQDMTALFEHFIDPTDERFRDPDRWGEAARLGRAPGRYRDRAEILASMLEAEPNAAPERVKELEIAAARQERHAVMFYDLTFNVSKSITTLHTACEWQRIQAERTGAVEDARYWAQAGAAIEDAVMLGNQTMLDYMQRECGYSRIGHHGGAAGQYIDAPEWIAASFLQHTNREEEPHLHVHNPVLNRVRCADGQWRAIHGTPLYQANAAGDAIGMRVVQETLLRDSRFPITFRARLDGHGQDIAGMDEDLLMSQSTRRRQVTATVQLLSEIFEAKHGRGPNAKELYHLRQQSNLITRRAKSHHAPSVEQRVEHAAAMARQATDRGLEQVADLIRPGRLVEPGPAQSWSKRGVIVEALALAQSRQATFTRWDIARAISDVLPADLGGLSPVEVTRLHDEMTDEAVKILEDVDGAGGTTAGAVSAYGAVAVTAATPARLPDQLKLNNGRSAYEAPGSQHYTTAEHIAGERLLAQAAVERGRRAVGAADADACLARLAEQGLNLGEDQTAAVRGIMTSGAAVEVLIGPAGTGKTRTAGALAAAWTDPQLWPDGQTPGRVIGLATAEKATRVLAEEDIPAANISAWLTAQRHRGGNGRPGEPGWPLAANDLVLVDESSMADTAALVEIHQHVAAAGAKLLLVGDHRQLAAVGASGALSLLTDQAKTYHLSEVRRFEQDWEAEASLKLREQDTAAVLDYERHGRLRDCGTTDEAERQAVTGYLADTLTGQRSILVTGSNEQAQRVSAKVRAELVALGRVAEAGVLLGLDANTAGVSDLVQARRNARQLIGYAGNTTMPVNRDLYRVVQTLDDGGLVVERVDGGPARLTLPASYVAEHLSLGYASTAHSAQGVTVDTAHVLVDQASGAEGAYVGLSRGRACNTAYVVTHPQRPDAAPGEAHDTPRSTPAAVLDAVLERTDPEVAAILEAARSTQAACSTRTLVERMSDVIGQNTDERITTILDRLTVAGVLSPTDRVRLATDDGAGQLGQLLRRAELAGHDLEQLLTQAVAGRSLAGARSVTQVVHHRIAETLQGQLSPAGDAFAERVPPIDGELGRYVRDLAGLADQRRRELGTQTATQAPAWALDAFGPVPDDPQQRAEWQHRAGVVAAWRELAGIDDDTVALGAPPKPGLTEHHAAFCSAWSAAGRPEAGREEAGLSEGALRCRRSAWIREQAHQPPYVADQARAANEQAATSRNRAVLLSARADAERDTGQAARLHEHAQQAWLSAEQAHTQARALEVMHLARGRWYGETAVTRETGRRAEHELIQRGVALDAEPDRTTAQQWLHAERTARVQDDPYRTVTEIDLLDDRNTSAEPHHEPDQQHEHDQPDSHGLQGDKVDQANETGPADDVDRADGVDLAGQAERIVAQAERAVREMNDRASQEEAHLRFEQTGLAEEWEAAARETAVRRDSEALAQAESADADAVN